MNKARLMILAMIIAGIFAFVSCSDEGNNDPNGHSVASCEGCHTDYEHLKTVFSPDTAVVSGGCSGDAPHYEPFDRVYLGGTGYETFKASKHYELGCVACHNGNNETDDKTIAHGGDFISHPSTAADEKCATCHSNEVTNVHNSIHQQGWGQKRKVTMRAGLAGAHEFDQLPEHVQEGYNANCATCHASTCGDCHVNRPPAGGGGLMKGHSFFEPDMNNTCVVCHTSRGGHAYLGIAPGTKPDVHLTKNGFDCMDCHSKTDVHGDGNVYEQRYAVEGIPECTDCHDDVSSANNYHSMHSKNLSCYTCHSQDYNNCGSCHVHGDGARIPSYQDFKIGINPLPELKGYKFALIRRAPTAPDQWEKYGMNDYADFAVLPTWNYTSPHNILRWTSRTQVEAGESCFANCHMDETGKNKDLYLFEDYLKDWEKAASGKITVDGKLPESWGVK